MSSVAALASVPAPPAASHAHIVDFETRQVEIVVETPGEPLQLRLRRNACPLGLLGFSLEERRVVAAWVKEHGETEVLVRCIQDRLVSGVFDGEEERRARIEAALQNNLRRLDELTVLLQTTKFRIIEEWRRHQAEDTNREKMLRAPLVTCG